MDTHPPANVNDIGNGNANVSLSFFTRQHKQPHHSDQDVLQNWVVIQRDRDHANIPQRPDGLAQNILPLQPELAWCVQSTIVYSVVVTLCQQLHVTIRIFVHLQYAMDDGDVAVPDFEDNDVADADFFDGVVQEQDVPPLECGLHAS